MEVYILIFILGACVSVLGFLVWRIYDAKRQLLRSEQATLDAFRAHINDEPLAELVRGINERDRESGSRDSKGG